MAKLGIQTTAGFNAGKTFSVKFIRIEDIVIDPEIADIFQISEKTLEEIKLKIKNYGYNKEEPVVIWKGRNILVDGRTRYTAAKDAGLEEIPVVEREFENLEEAIFYTIERQVLRRNLTGREIIKATRMIPDRKARDGEGTAADQMAERLGKSKATVYQARAILKEAPEEIVQAVENGDMSIKKAYNTIRQPKLPESARFLKDAVIMLIEKGHQEAAELLISHFLKKNEKEVFCELLPSEIRKELEDSTSKALPVEK